MVTEDDILIPFFFQLEFVKKIWGYLQKDLIFFLECQNIIKF